MGVNPTRLGSPDLTARQKEIVISSQLQSRLFDLATAAPMLVLSGLGIISVTEAMSGQPKPDAGAITLLSQLLNLLFMGLLIILLCIRRLPFRKARGFAPRAAGLLGMLAPTLAVVLPKAKLTSGMMAFSSATMLVGTLASVFICFWLGRSFSILPQARGLVTDGPYRLVRHPLYLAELVVVFGVMWEYEWPWSLLLVIFAILAQVPRMHFEEQILMEAYPTYRDYARRKSRLVPGLY